MATFTNAYEVLEHLMNNSKDGDTSMWGLLKTEVERLRTENEELTSKADQLETDNVSALLALTEIYEQMIGGTE